MRIKNLEKIKALIKAKLPEYLKEIGCTIEVSKVSCPNIEAHEHEDKGKLSAAFLPRSNNQAIYCFVEERAFDIFDVYAVKTDQTLNGGGFYKVVKELAEKYNIPIEEEYEYSMKEKELNRKKYFLQKLHKLSTKDMKRGAKYYKQRRLTKDKIKYFQIGWLEPNDITKELDEECKTLFDYKLSSVFLKGGLVMPIFNKEHQYNGLVIRMFETKRNDEYLKICIEGSNLFNVNNVRGKEELTIVEGSFDAIALHPLTNVVGCLTNVVNDANLETIADMQMAKINIALDPDNLFKGKARDGILRTILRMKNLEAQINIIKFPDEETESKLDPDEYMKNHSLEDYKNLPKIPALVYLLKNHKKGVIKAKDIYEFIAGCPDMIRKEKYINIAHKFLKVGKRELTKEIDNISQDQHSFNMIQYVQEKDSYDTLLEEFTEQAWNKNYSGVPTGYPLFDRWVGGLEDTLYLFIGHPETGKSHPIGTKVLMADGSIEEVQNIKVGDYVMGEFSQPVMVTSTHSNKEMLYDIVPNKGDVWGCNASHILVLNYKNGCDKTIEISMKDFLKKSKAYQERCKLIRVGVELPEKPIDLDPYFVGLWLGDGTKKQSEITNSDKEICDYLLNFSKENNLNYRSRSYKNSFVHILGKNTRVLQMRKQCVIKEEKRIPKNYLINNRENRLKLLAGLIDTDGYLSSNMYEITTKYNGLASDILYLARSLGFQATLNKEKVVKGKVYQRILISGELTTIPVKVNRRKAPKRISRKNHLRSGFTVVEKGIGQYYGFTLDKKSNSRYLLGDFTLTHNSATLLNFIYNLAHYKNAFVAFYSLDDGAKRSIIPRLMSIASGLTSKVIKQPSSEIKEQWFKGLDRLKELKEHMVIKDGGDIKTIKDLDNYVKIHRTMAEEQGKKFILAIDNVHDIRAGLKFESVQNSQKVAEYLKRLPQQLNCPIIATAEVPKSAAQKPTGEDIKESIDLWYAARFVCCTYSNFHKVKNKNDTNLVWVDENRKYNPIIELLISKNQTGDTFHGSLFYKLSQINNRLIEASEQEMQLLKDGQFLTFRE